MIRVTLATHPPRDVAVTVHDPDARLADLLAAAHVSAGQAGQAGQAAGRWWVDGVGADPARRLAELPLVDGAVVSPHPVAPALRHAVDERPCGPGSPVVAVVAGPGSGRVLPLPARGRVVVGRAADADLRLDDPTVSLHHLAITTGDRVVLEDLGSRNGTWVGGRASRPGRPTTVPAPVTARLGACVVRIAVGHDCDTPAAPVERAPDGRRLVRRPPRPAPPPPPEPVVVPSPASAPERGRELRWAAVVAPLAMGGVMVLVTGNPRFALFVLVSPVVAVATWLAGRRASRRRRRAAAATWEDTLATVDARLAASRSAWIAREEEVVPPLDEVLRRAVEPSVRLWERRPDHADALVVRLGSGDRELPLPLERPAPAGTGQAPGGSTDARRSRIEHLVASRSRASHVPVRLALADRPIIGLVGDRKRVLGLARALVLQLAVLHGPADLHLVVAPGPGCPDWAWTRWLPHDPGRDGPGRTGARHEDHAGAHPEPRGPRGSEAEAVVDGAATVLVLDRGAHDATRPGGRGRLSGAPGPTLVLADHPHHLPADCATVVRVGRGAESEAVALEPATGRRTVFLPNLLDEADARTAARALAHLADPEADEATRLPDQVRLVDLLEDEPPSAGLPGRAPQDPGHAGSAGPVPGLATPLGWGPAGPLWVDLVPDGPHALVAGTTGSGKSELLRSLVVGLATRHGPEQVVFVLVDYKGGAAFRACRDLPHVVGLVTDLDEHLGARAITSLEAELRHRERVLSRAGVSDVADLASVGMTDPLPRLVVVVDEFATLAAELPDVVDALVGVARRGRSLGIHLVLATQRPRGAVDADVRANTDLRIALRVQDEVDSRDVVDAPVAATLPRTRPGRAVVRRGPGDLVVVQAAIVSLPVAAADRPRVEVHDLDPPTRASTAPTGPASDVGGPSDLECLVRAARDRHVASGARDPRRPWLPMLPTDLSLRDAWAGGGDRHGTRRDGGPPGPVVLGLVDRPDRQSREALAWDPAVENLTAVGPLGSGTSTTLRSTVVAAARATGPDDLHVHAIDAGGGALALLEDVPHVGCVLGIDRADEHALLLGRLAGEVRDRRARDRAGRRDRPRVLVVVDGLPAFLAAHDDRVGDDLRADLATVLRDGPGVGIATVAATDRLVGLPGPVRQDLGRILLHGRVDERDLALLGRRPSDLPPAVPGRALDAADGTTVQVARAPRDTGLHELVDTRSSSPVRRPPWTIRGLPDAVALDALPRPAGDGALELPLGRARSGETASVVVRPGDHLAIGGPNGSGRTTTLQVLSAQLRRARPDATQVALCDPDRSALHGWPSLDASGSSTGLRDVVGAGATRDDPWFVLVDDVRWCGDDDLLSRLVVARPDLHLVVAGRADDLRGGFGTWHRELRRSGTGVLLRPDLATDGELLGARLPRGLRVRPRPGRGFVVDAGTAVLAQLADAPATPPPGSLA